MISKNTSNNNRATVFGSIVSLLLWALLFGALHNQTSQAQVGGAQGNDDSAISGVNESSKSADIKVEAFLNLTKMSFDDSVILTIRLTWDKDEFEPAQSSAPKLDLKRLRVGAMTSRARSLNERSRIPGQGSRVSQEHIYTLLPIASGKGLVRPVKVGFIRKSDSQLGSISTTELNIYIAMPARENSSSGTDWRIIGLVIFVLLCLSGFSLVVLRRRKLAKMDKEKSLLAWKSIALELGELKTATSGSKADFFENLYDFIYTYSRDAGYISGRRGDSDSLIEELRQCPIAEDIKLPLVKWLELSSTEKFSPGRGTPGESLRVYYEVEAFVREHWQNIQRQAHKSTE